MYAASLELKDFRNYERLSVTFDPQVNIFCGNNAQGKTNVLEAVFLACTTKSHRGSRDREMIRLGTEEAHIRLGLVKDSVPHRIDMHLKKNKPKGIAIDGVPIHKSGELLGFVKVIFFSPEDLSMIKNGPGERRRFLDMELCQLEPFYVTELTNYNRILLQRNNLLRQISPGPGGGRTADSGLLDTLSVWDEQLLDYGSKIMKARAVFLQQLSPVIEEVHGKLSGGTEQIQVRYEPGCAEEAFAEKLREARSRDLFLKTTTVGPHRDDILFLVNGLDARRYASQGQQRTAALSLKLSEIEIVKQRTGEKPILLLDDVLSELDRNRQNYLLDSIEEIQTMITCTGLEEFVGSRLEKNRSFEVKAGRISRNT